MVLSMHNKYNQKQFWWLLVATASLLFMKLGSTPLYILDEAKNAQCAAEMLEKSNWIVPTFNSELRTDKPPLHYFFMMLSYKIFGINAFAARFFSAIAGLGTICVTYFYTKKYINKKIAFFSVLVLVTSTHFLFEFRLSVPDPYLIFFITLGFFSFFAWLDEKKTSQLYLGAFALGMATLAKGPIALALPAILIFIWVIWQKKWSYFFSWHLISAFALVMTIVLPWYILVYKATNGKWITSFLFEHNIERFASPKEGHGGLFILPVLFVLIGLLPYTAFIAELIRERKKLFKLNLEKYALLSALVPIAFFCFAGTKLPNYPMISYPFISILLGSFINELVSIEFCSKKYPFFVLLVFLILIPVAGYFAINNEIEAANNKWVALLLLIAPLILFLFLFRQKQWKWGTNILALSITYLVFNIIGLLIVYPVLYQQNPVYKTLKLFKKDCPVIAYRQYNPGYNFNLKNSNIITYQSIADLNNALEQKQEAIIITREEYLDSLQLLSLEVIAKHHDLFELPTTVVLKKLDAGKTK
ncbi:glycosyltransferase family 39 protein [Sediminibacterium sp. C3]|uniref:ArnT family glycosyltransferase n=1 Tax=Sediminibacterium sp. C3 TaxID=1267211 RepID=UPI0003FD1A04|nr:glycosyltransferase family 39 protein [Sediminibacterium sp. C3]